LIYEVGMPPLTNTSQVELVDDAHLLLLYSASAGVAVAQATKGIAAKGKPFEKATFAAFAAEIPVPALL
jgi:hypothetical protein